MKGRAARGRTLPSGWNGALGASSLTISAGATASTTLSVTSSSTAAAGSYGIGVGSSSAAASEHTASASATYTVAAAAGTLSGSIATDKSLYLRGETVYLSARVLSSGTPVAGASVRFTISPGGTATLLNATSGSDGYARSTYKLGKGKAAIGTYGARADATRNGATATASTSFTAK